MIGDREITTSEISETRFIDEQTGNDNDTSGSLIRDFSSTAARNSINTANNDLSLTTNNNSESVSTVTTTTETIEEETITLNENTEEVSRSDRSLSIDGSATTAEANDLALTPINPLSPLAIEIPDLEATVSDENTLEPSTAENELTDFQSSADGSLELSPATEITPLALETPDPETTVSDENTIEPSTDGSELTNSENSADSSLELTATSSVAPLAIDNTSVVIAANETLTESNGPILSVGNNIDGARGTKVTVPIAIDNAVDLVSLNLTLEYDTNLLDILDPNPETEIHEGIRRTGLSANWVLTSGEGNNPNAELPNPTVNVIDDLGDGATGQLTLALINPTETPATGTGNIVEIDFLIDPEADLNAIATINLREARLGTAGATEETVIGDSLLDDGSIQVGLNKSLDIDGNGTADALTDGVLILRELFGFSGNTLINGAVASDATRTAADDIQAYISQIESSLDIDGNGTADALTDGVLILRHLFGFSGDTLINGAVASDATRTTADEIANAIDDLIA